MDLNPLPALIRLLNHSNIKFVDITIASINNIIIEAKNTKNNIETHPLFQIMYEIGGIQKIFELFNRNVSKFSKDRAALIISSIYYSKEITN